MIYETDTDMVALYNGSAWRYIAATTPTNGTVLQTVTATYSTLALNSTTTFADTGLSASITPKSSASKVLVLVNHTGCGKTSGNANSYLYLRLLRGSTEICAFENAAGYTGTSIDNYFGSCSTAYLDSPATTSSTTYKTQGRVVTTANNSQLQFQDGGTTNSIILLEIGA